MHEDPQPGDELIPKRVRSVAYMVGTMAAAGAVAAPEPVARYLAALATAALAIAVGYRPTR